MGSQHLEYQGGITAIASALLPYRRRTKAAGCGSAAAESRDYVSCGAERRGTINTAVVVLSAGKGRIMLYVSHTSEFFCVDGENIPNVQTHTKFF